MAESELKLDLPCPRCGTSNLPTAQRCRQCYHEFMVASAELQTLGSERTPTGDLFDMFPPARPMVACEACGKANLLNAETCHACGAPMPGPDEGGQPLESLEAAIGGSRLREAVRSRRRHELPENPSWLNFAWLLRLCSVLFLFWGVIDTSIWLTSTTKSLAPSDPAGLRYSVFAIYELVRNLCIVAGVWLLTVLNPRR